MKMQEHWYRLQGMSIYGKSIFVHSVKFFGIQSTDGAQNQNDALLIRTLKMKNPFQNKIEKWFRLPFSLWSIDHFVVEVHVTSPL